VKWKIRGKNKNTCVPMKKEYSKGRKDKKNSRSRKSEEYLCGG
jgi:hypothetical protein